jgi:DNA polymerase III subunit delta
VPPSRARAASQLPETPSGGVYFLHGAEEFGREESVRKLIALHLNPATRDFNLDQLRGGDVTPDSLASLVATPPMMAAFRVLVIRDAQGLSARAREQVEGLLAAPPPDLCLILSAAIPSGSKAAFYSRLIKQATSLEFAAVEELDAPDWVIARAAETHGVEWTRPAARALVAAVGTGQGVLASEIAKIAEYVQGRPTVEVSDVTEAVGVLPRVDRWGWMDAVAERRFSEARRDLPALLSADTGVGLVIGLGTHFLRLAIAVEQGEKGLATRLKPFQRWMARRVTGQAREWTPQQVEGALAELARIDRLMKSGGSTDHSLLEGFLLRLEIEARGARGVAA